MGRADTASQEPPPIYVDLDGTLIKSDLLYETFFALLAKKPFCFLNAILWLLVGGKARLKAELARRIELDPTLLPYNSRLIDYLRRQFASGRRIVFATAANGRLAERIAEHLGCFHAVLASDDQRNLCGPAKLDAIRIECGGGPFCYIGNGHDDVPIFEHAQESVLVNPARGVMRRARRLSCNVADVFEERTQGLRAYLRAFRIHQWAKNLLLFLPLLATHRWGNLGDVLQLTAGFFAFGIVASGVYLLNDLLDLEADRAHPRKRFRPLASGAIPIATGAVLAVVLPLLGLLLAWSISTGFLALLTGYLALTMAYSTYLKRIVLIDVMALATLYTVRVLAGVVILEVVPSFWMLAFSMFLFLSLAILKRGAELVSLQAKDDGEQKTRGRDYRVSDLGALLSLGSGSGYMAVLVVALFINSPEVAGRYTHPQLLWLLCPLLLFWISRLWLATQRGEMDDDPLLFSLKDRASQLVALFSLLAVIAAV